MNADDVWAQIKGGRGTTLEWSGENTAPDALGTVLTSLANAQGGLLVLGVVGPAATLIGVRDPESTVDRVLQAALAIEPPLIIPMPRVVRVNDRSLVVVTIPPGMPHVYAHDGRYLQRQGTENTLLKVRDLRRLIIERGEVSFETEAARGAALDDIDWEKARVYVASLSGLNEVETVLLKRGCLVKTDAGLRPTNAGILLFGKDPQAFMRGVEITAARFAGETMSDTFSRQDIGGTLPDQIRKAETFLADHLRKNTQLGRTMARDDRFEYPLEAARELVVNAVAHRDYSIAGDGIRLYVFRNRMEITSPGGLPGPVTIANIKDERFSRNPVIVQVLSDMGFIERLGYGVDRVYDLMRERELRAPYFEETGGGFRATLYNEDEAERGEAELALSTILAGEGAVALNPRQEAALTYLRSGNTRITNSDLQTLHPDVHPETIRRDLADLVTKNILRKMGEKRGSYYVLNKTE